MLHCGDSALYYNRASEVITGINWVNNNATRPAVVNMSLGGPSDQTMNDAVARGVASGLLYVVSAGNCIADYTGTCAQGPWNACTRSPSGAGGALAVGATDRTDRWAYFSNYGGCVAISAPGVDVVSDFIGSTTATHVYSGTSQASPHVAGAAALIFQAHMNSTGTAAAVRQALIDGATPNKISGIAGGTPNKLLTTFATLLEGPSTVTQYGSCNWRVTPSGATPPYSYSWTVNTWLNGQPVGTWVPPMGSGQSFTSQFYNNGTGFNSGNVTLTVTDARGWSVSTTKSLTYAFGGGSCY